MDEVDVLQVAGVDVEQSATDAARIHVVIAPVGQIADDVFQRYANVLREYQLIEMKNITPAAPVSPPGRRPSFGHQSWATGVLRFKFLAPDDLASGEQLWASLQAHRRVLGVLAIADAGSSVTDLAAEHGEFLRLLAKHASAMTSRLFAVHPRADQPDIARDHLVMIPPPAEVDADDAEQHMRFYLNTLVHDFASEMLRCLDSYVNVVGDSGVITTPADRIGARGGSSGNDESLNNKVRKRFPGRLQKTLGDYCLLAGSPIDAAAAYASASDITRGNSDWIWMAAAIEGQVAATLLTSPSGALPPDLLQRYDEAIALYQRVKVPSLLVEALFKLARLHVLRGPPGVLGAMEVLMRARACADDLPSLDRIVVSTGIAALCRTLGFARKYAFFLREAAQLSVEMIRWQSAHQLLLLTAPHYQLAPTLDAAPTAAPTIGSRTASMASLASAPSTPTLSTGGSAAASEQPAVSGDDAAAAASSGLVARADDVERVLDRSQAVALLQRVVLTPAVTSRHVHGGWAQLQLSVLRDLVRAARALGDVFRAVCYMAYMLQNLHRSLATPAQRQLVHDIRTAAAQLPPFTQVDLLAVPSVRSPRALPLRPGLVPVPVQGASRNARDDADGPGDDDGDGGGADVFIFKAFGRSARGSARSQGGSAAPVWVAHEAGSVRVLLSNPLQVPIKIDSITLDADGVAFESYPQTVSLPARATNVAVTLVGKPLQPGELQLIGVDVQVMGVVCHHAFKQPLALASPRADPAALCVSVLPPLPRLVLREATLLGNQLSLAEGEDHVLLISLENSGALPITELRVDVDGASVSTAPPPPSIELPAMPDGVDVEHSLRTWLDESLPVLAGWRGQAHALASFDPAAVQRNLPLPAGRHIDLAVRVCGIAGASSIVFRVAYRGTDVASYERHALLPIQLRVLPGPRVESFDVVPCQNKGSGMLAGDAKTQCFVVLELSNPTPNAIQVASYVSSGRTDVPGTDPRSVAEAGDGDVFAAAVEEEEDAMPRAASRSSFIGSEHTAARFADGMAMEAAADEPASMVVVEPGAVKRVLLPLSRFTLPAPLYQPVQKHNDVGEVKNNIALLAVARVIERLSDEQRALLCQLEAYRVALLQRLRFRWHSETCSYGALNLRRINVQPRMLALLQPPPVSFSVSVMPLDQQAGQQSLRLLKARQLYRVCIHVTNASASALPGLVLRIQPYQDLENGRRTSALAGHMAWLGSLQRSLRQLSPSETVTEEFVLTVLQPGLYKLVYHVQHAEEQRMHWGHGPYPLVCEV